MPDTPYLDDIIEAGPEALISTEALIEIRDILQSVGSMGQRGTATLNSKTGVEITIPEDIGSVDYDVFVTIPKDTVSSGNIGEITYHKTSGTSFTLFNSGSDNTTQIRWWVIPL